MAQADGTILIDTEINADGMKTESKEVEKNLKHVASVIEEETSHIKDLHNSALNFINDYVDNLDKASKSNNKFKNNIEALKKELKSLEDSGQFFGDDDYDETYLKLKEATDALNDYKKSLDDSTSEENPFGLDTYAGKIREAEIELNNLAQAGKGLGDADYDEAYRNLALLLKEAKEYRKELEKTTEIVPAPNLDTYEGKIQQLQNQLNALKQAGKGLGDADYDEVFRSLALLKNEQKEYIKELTKTPDQRQREQDKLNALNQKLAETEAKEARAAAEALKLRAIGDMAEISNQDIVDLNNELTKLKARQAELDKAGLGTGYKEYDENISRIAQIESELRNYSNTLKVTKKDEDKLNTSNNKLTKSNNKVAKSLNRTGKAANNANMGIGRMLASSILFSTVFSAISLVTSGIGEGIQNLAQYSNEFNQNMSMLMSALTRLKNAFATAFAPILDVVAPILTSFINLLADAITYVAAFFSALTGKDTFTKAKKVQQDYAESLKDTADSTKEAAKEAEKYLSPLDDINKFTEKDKDKSNKGESGAGELAPGDMFETAKIPDSVKNLADEMRKIFSGIFDVFKEAWDNKGAAVINSAKGALNSLKNAAKAVGTTFYDVFTNGTGLTWAESLLNLFRSMLDVVKSIADAFTTAWNSGAGFDNVTALFNMLTNVNNLLAAIGDSFSRVFSNGTGVAIWTNILQIITGVYNFIGNIARQLTIAWNTAGIGDGIWQGILDIVNSVLSFINRIVTATANWAGNLNFVPLLSSIKNLLNSISPVVQAIGDFLGDIYEKIILPIAKKLIESILPKIIDAVSKLFDFLGKHGGVIEAVGAALIGAFAASKIVPLITTIIGAVQGIITILSSSGLLGAIGGIVSVLGGPLTIAITAIIAAGVLLITHWDDVKKAASAVASWIGDKWDAIKKKTTEIWNSIKSFVTGIWNGLKSTASTIFNGIKSTVSTVWNNIKSTASSVWNGIKSTVTGIWNGLKSSASSIFNGIKNTITGVWNTIKTKTSNVWNKITSTIKGAINGVIGGINGMIRGVVSGMNSVIRALNNLSFTVPSWVPSFGGKTFGFNIGTISAPQIPYLASGAVIPPNKEFLAVLGDQNKGNNIEAPESLIRRIVREESGGNSSNTYEVSAKVGRKELFKIIIDEAKMQRTQTGRNPFELA